jgi:short-subunit dehydrogenase
VHNAGVGRWRFLDEGGAEEVVETMALPYLAAAWLTRALLPAMRERRSGHIVTVGSAASRLAWPGATTYIAAARALRGFADALRADLKGTGIGVTHYESGPVESPYWTNNPGSRERIPGIARRLIPVLGEDAAAAAVVRAVERNRSFTVVPARLRLVYGLHRLSPGAVQWLMTETGYRPGSG